MGRPHEVDLNAIRGAVPGWAFAKGRKAGVCSLADACKLSRQTLHRLLNLGTKVEMPTLAAVLHELGLPFDKVVRRVQ